MGYSHYFTLKKPIATADWAKIKTATRKIIQASGQDLEDCSNAGCIHLNGWGPDSHETFYLDTRELGFNFCKTANKPYDVVVVAVLAAVFTLTGDKYYTIKSDGDEADWVAGVNLAKEALGIDIVCPIVDEVVEVANVY